MMFEGHRDQGRASDEMDSSEVKIGLLRLNQQSLFWRGLQGTPSKASVTALSSPRCCITAYAARSCVGFACAICNSGKAYCTFACMAKATKCATSRWASKRSGSSPSIWIKCTEKYAQGTITFAPSRLMGVSKVPHSRDFATHVFVLLELVPPLNRLLSDEHPQAALN
jgi:hypothetical protein